MGGGHLIDNYSITSFGSGVDFDTVLVRNSCVSKWFYGVADYVVKKIEQDTTYMHWFCPTFSEFSANMAQIALYDQMTKCHSSESSPMSTLSGI